MSTLLKPGRNCWQVAPADRVAFLIDGEAYFAAFWEAAAQARESILIAGWDMDSRVQLLRDGRPRPWPVGLGAFLDALVRRRPELQVHLLVWDFAALYLAEREWLSRYKWYWGTHRRVHFELDNTQPPGGSHHQKIVVVDDAVAFVGGFDFTRCRWDTAAHRADDPRRVDADGTPYSPFHDCALMVDGAAAKALGDLVRSRWQRATGETLLPPRRRNDPWPEGIGPALKQVRVAIARTEPATPEQPAVREVEQLYLDAIAAARKSIYIENQYLTSATVGEALAARLQEADGPQVLLVVPCRTEGWLEQVTMDVLRSRLVEQLRAADRYGRLRIMYPDAAGLGEACINVHAKILVIDEELARVGSANLSNRSMGLDTECDLALEAGGDSAIQRVIGEFRNGLLAHHLGVEPERVKQALIDQGSLLAAVASLRGGSRTLKELDGRVAEALALTVPDAALIDPEQPLTPSALSAWWLQRPGTTERGPTLVAQVGNLLTDSAYLALGMVFYWTALDDWLIARLTAAQGWLAAADTGDLA